MFTASILTDEITTAKTKNRIQLHSHSTFLV